VNLELSTVITTYLCVFDIDPISILCLVVDFSNNQLGVAITNNPTAHTFRIDHGPKSCFEHHLFADFQKKWKLSKIIYTKLLLKKKHQGNSRIIN